MATTTSKKANKTPPMTVVIKLGKFCLVVVIQEAVMLMSSLVPYPQAHPRSFTKQHINLYSLLSLQL